MEGEDPTSLFADMHGDRDVVVRVMMQYDTTRGARGLNVELINDPTMSYGT